MPSAILPPFWHPCLAGGFILDWDGVLAETKLNFAPVREKYFEGRFVPLFEAIETLPPDLAAALEKDIYDVEMGGAECAEPVDGAMELIAWLEEKKISWCVVSRNCHDSITLAAEKTGIPLPQIVRSRDEPPVKPEPEALWSAALEMGAAPEKCVMVGDFVFDLVGARRAGMRAVLVQRPEAVWKYWADVSFDRLAQFVESLNAPEPLVPWEYAALAAEIGKEGLKKAAEKELDISASDPRVLPFLLKKAAEGTVLFRLDDPLAALTPEQWVNMPGLAPSWLDQPIVKVAEYLLNNRFPLAKVLFEEDRAGTILREISVTPSAGG
jgi:HAD superfamily hydrolase (TIGR01549 family)